MITKWLGKPTWQGKTKITRLKLTIITNYCITKNKALCIYIVGAPLLTVPSHKYSVRGSSIQPFLNNRFVWSLYVSVNKAGQKKLASTVRQTIIINNDTLQQEPSVTWDHQSGLVINICVGMAREYKNK